MGLVRRQVTEAGVGASPEERRQARLRRHVAIVAGVVAVEIDRTRDHRALGDPTRQVGTSGRGPRHRGGNGAGASCCDLPLDQVVFPGTDNSMSSALYPGWLFGEQVNTIKAQLNAGVRALLIDTDYGVPSTAYLPGSGSPWSSPTVPPPGRPAR